MLGYLYIAEKKVKKELMTLIAKLNADPSWADRFAASTGKPAHADAYRTEVADIERKMDGANVANLRHWRDLLAKVHAAAGGAPAPTPVPKPTPKPEPKLPPAPPGIKCPHYSKASAFPENWDDPAAEKRYVDANPDVKNWVDVMAKRFKGKGLTALWHYRCYGAKENRTWAGWDLDFDNIPGYLR